MAHQGRCVSEEPGRAPAVAPPTRCPDNGSQILVSRRRRPDCQKAKGHKRPRAEKNTRHHGKIQGNGCHIIYYVTTVSVLLTHAKYLERWIKLSKLTNIQYMYIVSTHKYELNSYIF